MVLIEYPAINDSKKKRKENSNNQESTFESNSEIKQSQVNELTTIPANLYIGIHSYNNFVPRIVFNANTRYTKKIVSFEYNQVKIVDDFIVIPIYLEKNGEKRELTDIIYKLPIDQNSYSSNYDYNFNQTTIYKYFPITIIFVWDPKCLKYAINFSESPNYSEYKILFENKILFGTENQNENENQLYINSQNEPQVASNDSNRPSFNIKNIINERQQQQQHAHRKDILKYKTPYQIQIFQINKNKEEILLTTFDKGLDFPLKCQISLTGYELDIHSDTSKVFISLSLLRDSTQQLELPMLEYELTQNDKKKNKKEMFVDIKFEWNKNGFCYACKSHDKNLFNKNRVAPSQIAEINKFCCNLLQ